MSDAPSSESAVDVLVRILALYEDDAVVAGYGERMLHASELRDELIVLCRVHVDNADLRQAVANAQKWRNEAIAEREAARLRADAELGALVREIKPGLALYRAGAGWQVVSIHTGLDTLGVYYRSTARSVTSGHEEPADALRAALAQAGARHGNTSPEDNHE